jgi:hypothetical protein
MSSIKLSAQKVKDASSLKKIAEAWKECAVNRGMVFYSSDNVTSVKDQLAGVGIDIDAFISSNDKYATRPDQSWMDVNNFMILQDVIWSYCFMIALPASVPLDTTPFAFTRGLNKNGLWDEKAGLYGSKGGYVVYCDGHIVWFDGSRPAKFLKWDKSGYSNDIRQAIPSSTWITCAHDFNQVRAEYWGENAKAIISAAGTGGS